MENLESEHLQDEEEDLHPKQPWDRAMDFCHDKGCFWCTIFSISALFATGMAILLWNENRYVMFDNTLSYITANVKEAGCQADPALNDGLVHVSCPVTHLPDLLTSPDLDWIRPLLVDKEVKGTDLIWSVEMYQWISTSKHKETVDNEKEKVWKKDWRPVDKLEWYEKNPKRIPPNARTGSVVGNPDAIWIGDKDAPLKGYRLSRYLRKQILTLGNDKVFRPDVKAKQPYPSVQDPDYGKKLEVDNFYTCGHIVSTVPCYGDGVIGAIRFGFQLVQPTHLSILARQHAPPSEFAEHDSRRLIDTTVKDFSHGYAEDSSSERVGEPADIKTFPPARLEDFDIPMGFISMSYDAEFLYDGHVSKDEMLEKLTGENLFALWLWRFAGYTAISLPLFVLLTVGPALLIDFASFVVESLLCGVEIDTTGCVLCIMWMLSWWLTLPLFLLIIGFCWLLVRPLIAISLMVPCALLVYFLKGPFMRAWQKKKERDMEVKYLIGEMTENSIYE